MLARSSRLAALLAASLLASSALAIDILRYVPRSAIPPPAEALCLRADSPITIDGKLDEPAWRSAAPMGRFSCYGTKRGYPEYNTTARLLWDDENLYVGFRATDPDIWSEITDRDGPLWEGEVLEVYVDPDGDGRDYKEFEVNPLNAVIDLNIEREEDGRVPDWKSYAQWDAEGWRTAVTVDGDLADRENEDRKWIVEMAIPFANFPSAANRPPQIGDTWRVQLYRIDRSNTLEKPEYSGWSPTDTFHRPSQFGFLTFAESP
jgi:hypothetical protein